VDQALPGEEHVKLSEPDKLRRVLPHGRAQDGPMLRSGDVDDVSQKETHRNVEEGGVLPQQVDRPQGVDRHTCG